MLDAYNLPLFFMFSGFIAMAFGVFVAIMHAFFYVHVQDLCSLTQYSWLK